MVQIPTFSLKLISEVSSLSLKKKKNLLFQNHTWLSVHLLVDFYNTSCVFHMKQYYCIKSSVARYCQSCINQGKAMY